MLRLKFTPTFSHPSLSLRQLPCALRFAWCSTPPTANAYTTRSCYARLPARFGHIILSCGVQFEGNRGRGFLTAQYRYAQCRIIRGGSRAALSFNYSWYNNCTALRPYLLQKGRRKLLYFLSHYHYEINYIS